MKTGAAARAAAAADSENNCNRDSLIQFDILQDCRIARLQQGLTDHLSILENLIFCRIAGSYIAHVYLAKQGTISNCLERVKIRLKKERKVDKLLKRAKIQI